MPFIVILTRGVQVSRLGCHGAAWSLTPNIDRLASQSLVFDQFLRENTQPELWGIQLTKRSKSWCWSGNTPKFADQYQTLQLVDPPPRSASSFPDWLKTIWSKLSKARADLLVIELNDAVPPWKPEQEDLNAYFPQQSEMAPDDAIDQVTLKQMNSTEGTGALIPEKDLAPWKGQLNQELITSSRTCPARESILLTHGAAIATVDKQLGIILDFLADHQNEETHILLTSDQGISLGEKGLYGHGVPVPWLDTVHVPLIWCHSTREASSLRHSALVSDKDLIELLMGNPKSPCGLLEKCWEIPRETGSETVVTLGRHQAMALRTKDWSLVVESSGSARLFEFPLDRWEVNDLATRHPNEFHTLMSLAETSPLSPSGPNHPGGQPR